MCLRVAVVCELVITPATDKVMSRGVELHLYVVSCAPAKSILPALT